MGSCECHGNGSGCKCGVSIDSKLTDSGKKKINVKSPLYGALFGAVILAYSLVTLPSKNNEAKLYNITNDALRSIELYESISKNYPVDGIEKKLKPENIDYYKYALKEDSTNLRSDYNYKTYENKLKNSQDLSTLGIAIFTGFFAVGLYRLTKSLKQSAELNEETKNDSKIEDSNFLRRPGALDIN